MFESGKNKMKKQIRIVKKGKDESNLLYWLSLTKIERLTQLEELRKEINHWKYGTEQGFQRVYRIVNRKSGQILFDSTLKRNNKIGSNGKKVVAIF